MSSVQVPPQIQKPEHKATTQIKQKEQPKDPRLWSPSDFEVLYTATHPHITKI